MQRIGLGGVIAIVAAGFVLALMVLVLVLLVSLVDTLGAAPRALGDAGARASAVSASAVRAAEGAAQAARDALDPTHPPRGPLAYDTELDELRRIEIGGVVAPHPERALALVAVRKRLGAEGPETAQYAVVDDRLATARENRVLGVVVSRTFDERERYLYQGQVFRVRQRLYKVNWISFEPPAVAIARLRDPNTPVAELAFAVE